MFFPYVAWNMDAVVFRRAGMVWCLAVYSGSAKQAILSKIPMFYSIYKLPVSMFGHAQALV
jgi:hypothetical protein